MFNKDWHQQRPEVLCGLLNIIQDVIKHEYSCDFYYEGTFSRLYFLRNKILQT